MAKTNQVLKDLELFVRNSKRFSDAVTKAFEQMKKAMGRIEAKLIDDNDRLGNLEKILHEQGGLVTSAEARLVEDNRLLVDIEQRLVLAEAMLTETLVSGMTMGRH